MSDISNVIEDVVKAGIAPILKNAGFKKSARNFHLVQPESIAVINVQASQWNAGNEGQFTLNVGRYYPSIDEQIRGEMLSRLPKEYQCTIRRRIGSLMPSRKDNWWPVATEKDNDRIVTETCDAVSNYALPWLTSIESIVGLTDLLDHEASFDAAEIFNALGNKASARKCLRRLISENPTDRQRIEGWAHQHELDLK